MHLLLIHSHWRPGGVRRVVEEAVVALAADARLNRLGVVLAAGEPPPLDWAQRLTTRCGQRMTVEWRADPWLAYASEWPAGRLDEGELTATLVRWIRSLPVPRRVVLENPAVGRHPVIGRVVAAACAATGTRLICHHHDFFVDGRWAHWPAIERMGMGSIAEALVALIPEGEGVSHLAVSARDARWLSAVRPTHWCPNPETVGSVPTEPEVNRARAWLAEASGTGARIWLCPTRVLRRKNVLEAAIWARWHDPDAMLVTTGAASSAEERAYADVVAARPISGGRGVCTGLVAAAEAAGRPVPRMAALMAASARVVVSSLFEGYGLPAAEAAAIGVPVTARRSACPDDDRARGADVYDDLWVPWALAGGPAERARQQRAWQYWCARVPPEVAAVAQPPPDWQAVGYVPFSRLTLAGQWAVWCACQRPGSIEFHRSTPPGIPVDFGQCVGGTIDRLVAAAPISAPSAVALVDVLVGEVGLRRPGGAGPDLRRWLGDRLAWANAYPLLWPGGDCLSS